jgi:hypothetical protein
MCDKGMKGKVSFYKELAQMSLSCLRCAFRKGELARHEEGAAKSSAFRLIRVIVTSNGD